MNINIQIGFYNAWIFMSVFIFQMLIIMFMGTKVRKKTFTERLDYGSFVNKNAGIIANIVWFITFLYSLFLTVKYSTTWFYIGLIIFVLGSSFLIIATCNFIKYSNFPVITKGAYRISRHPMYFATFIICLGIGIIALSVILICLNFLMSIFFYLEAINEERSCLNRNKNIYEEYMERVPRILFKI